MKINYATAFALMFWLPAAAHATCCEQHPPWKVIGPIEDKYFQLGGPNGFLGPPTSNQQPAKFGGLFQVFTNGVIYWHPDASVGAHEVHGAILDLWTNWGRESFGYPITDETGAPDGRGRFNHFRLVQLLPAKEDRSIYWTPTTQAHSVIGAIRAEWAQWEWQRGKLGYPISEETQDSAGRKKSYFEFGLIRWLPPGGPAAVMTYDNSPETMTDRCSGDVSFPPAYGGQPTNVGAAVLTRGPDGYSDWTPIFVVGLDDAHHVRWFCHSTSGNFLDPGTWRLRDTGAACQLGDSGGGGSGGGGSDGGGSKGGAAISLSSSVSCTTTVNLNSNDAGGWTAEQSRCNDRTNMFRARLGPDRLLETLCVESMNSAQ